MSEYRGPVRLRLRPDGHWMPDTVGRWRWRSLGEVEGRSSGLDVEVFERHGTLRVRVVGSDEGDHTRVDEAPPGQWEWVTPREDADASGGGVGS